MPDFESMSPGNERAVVPAKAAEADWEAIERAYRTNHHTLRELQKLYGPSPASILRRVKRHGWQKDLSEPIRSATKQAVLQAVVDEKRRREGIALRLRQQGVLEADAEQIAASAEVGANVALQHRQDIGMMRRLGMKMASDLAAAFEHSCAIEVMAEVILLGDDVYPGRDSRLDVKARLAELLNLPDQIKSLERLATLMAKLQQMERAAYDLDRQEKSDPRSVAVRAMSPVERVHRLKYLLRLAASRQEDAAAKAELAPQPSR